MKNYFKHRRAPVIRSVPSMIYVLVAATGLLLYKLFSLVPFADYEQPLIGGSANVELIKNNILFAPLKAVQFLILKGTSDDTYIRLASVIVALIAAYFLYILLLKWHTRESQSLPSRCL